MVDGFVAEAQVAHQPLPASEPLLRAVHTLNGAVAMVDVPVITQVLAPLENYIKRLCAGHQAPTPDGLMVLSEASELIRRVLAALDRQTHLPNADDLAQRIGMLRDTLPEPQLMHTLFTRGETAHETAETAPVADAPVESAALEPAAEEPAGELESEFAAVQSIEEAAPPATDESTSRTDWLDALLPEETPASEPELHEPADLEAPAHAAADSEEAVLLSDEFAMAPPVDDMSPADVVAIDIPVESETVELAAVAPAADAPAEVTTEEPVAEAPAEVMADEPVAAIDMEEISPADVVQFMDAPIAAQIPEAFAAQLPAQPEEHEPALVPAADGLGETFAELPALADDPQPEGRLELAEMDEDLLEDVFVQEGRRTFSIIPIR